MSDLTGKFSTLEAELTSIGDEAHSQRVATNTAIADVQTAVDNVGAEIAALRNLMLSAIGQSDPCMTCPPPSLITPVTNPTGRPINADKCKRVHAFLNALHEISGVFGAVSNNAIVWTPSIVNAGISEVLTTLVTTGSVPLPSFGESVNIAGDTINYALSNIGRGDNLQSQFDSITSGMVNGLYNTPNAADIQSQYTSSVDGSGLPNDEKLLFKALGFNALFSYFFDPTSHPDLTAYSGTDCGDLACMTFTTAEMVTFTGEFGSGWMPDWSKYGLTAVSLPGQTQPQWLEGDRACWTADTTGFADVHKLSQQFPGDHTDEVYQFPHTVGDTWLTIYRVDGPFSLTFCPTAC